MDIQWIITNVSCLQEKNQSTTSNVNAHQLLLFCEWHNIDGPIYIYSKNSWINRLKQKIRVWHHENRSARRNVTFANNKKTLMNLNEDLPIGEVLLVRWASEDVEGGRTVSTVDWLITILVRDLKRDRRGRCCRPSTSAAPISVALLGSFQGHGGWQHSAVKLQRHKKDNYLS